MSRAAHRIHPMGPLELEVAVERQHSGAVVWQGEAKPPKLISRPQAEDHLRWYFGDAAGELGLRGMNLEPSPGGSDGVAAAERQTAAYSRYVDVRSALLRVDGDDRRVLALAYLERTWPEGLADWYEKAGVGGWLVARTEQACHGRTISVDDGAAQLAAMVRVPAKQAEAALLRARAERRLREALQRFCEAWEGGR